MSLSLRHYLHVRGRLLISIIAGLICFFALPAHLGILQRLMTGWNVLAWMYLFFLWFRMLRTEAKRYSAYRQKLRMRAPHWC